MTHSRLALAAIVSLTCALGAVMDSPAVGQTNGLSTVLFAPEAAPPITSAFVGVANGHLSLGGSRVAFFGVNVDWWALASCLQWNGKAVVIDAGQQAAITAQLDNLVNAGVRAIRIHNLDCANGSNIFCAGNGPMTSTRSLDPMSVQALGWFVSQCKARNLRIVLTINHARTLQPATSSNNGDLPPWPCACFAECVANKGNMHPWKWFETDGGLTALEAEYAANLLAVPLSDGTPLGKSPVLLAVVLQNEHSVVKDFSFSSPYPVLQGLLTASQQAFAAAQNPPVKWVGTYTLNKTLIQQWLAGVETSFLTKQLANIRTLTPALVITDTYYGDGPWSMFPGMNIGDVIDEHFYSRYATTDTNGFLSGQSAMSARSRFAAVLAGGACATSTGASATVLSNGGKPQFVTEWGPVLQQPPFPRDPDSERASVMKAMVQAAIAQDVDAVFLYSWAHAPIFPDGSPYSKLGSYDFRDDTVLLAGFPSHVAWFHDLTMRPTSATAVSPTNGLNGAGTGSAYQLFGPYTDPALYALPAGQKATVTP
jgi:hypothetical protein